MPSAHRYTQRSLPSGWRLHRSYSWPQRVFRRETTAADSPTASFPTKAWSASLMLPVEIPFRYNHGSAASTLLARRTYGGTSVERNTAPSPERSRTLGTCTRTGPMPAIGLTPPLLLLQKHSQLLLDRPTNQFVGAVAQQLHERVNNFIFLPKPN